MLIVYLLDTVVLAKLFTSLKLAQNILRIIVATKQCPLLDHNLYWFFFPLRLLLNFFLHLRDGCLLSGCLKWHHWNQLIVLILDLFFECFYLAVDKHAHRIIQFLE